MACGAYSWLISALQETLRSTASIRCTAFPSARSKAADLHCVCSGTCALPRKVPLILEMKVFVLGATGFLGSRVLPLLANAGHEVAALVADPEDAEKLKARNVQIVPGDLNSLDAISQAALEADAVLHLEFPRDFTQYAEYCLVDVRLSETVNQALAGMREGSPPAVWKTSQLQSNYIYVCPHASNY